LLLLFYWFLAKDILEHDLLFLEPRKINIPLLADHMRREGRVNISDISRIVNFAVALFKTEPNVLEIPNEVRVVGDLHGFGIL
jgi:hypothetical protein